MGSADNKRKFLLSAGLVLGCWTMVAFAFSINQYISQRNFAPEKDFSFIETFTLQFFSCLGWVFLTPVIHFVAKRFLPVKGSFYSGIFFLSLTGIVVIILQTIYQVAVLPYFGLMMKFEYVSFFGAVKGMLVSNSLLSLSLYLMTLGVVLVNIYYRQVQERELVNSKLESSLIRSRLQTLKMQLHPHFLFNTHNAISELVYSDPETAEKMIANLSDLLRISLENLEIEEVTLHEELAFVKKYVEIEQIRFQDRLKFKLDISPDTFDAIVPNMILQPLIENAVRHGITPLKQGGTVTVAAFLENGKLHLSVVDDGIGIGEHLGRDRKSGIGLKNTRERLLYMYGNDQTFQIASEAGKGFSVLIEIPFNIHAVSEEMAAIDASEMVDQYYDH